jgi:hypothetical protein
MSRLFSSTTDRIEKASPVRFPGGQGTLSFWLRPSWNSGDGVDHVFCAFTNAAAAKRLVWQKFSDNNIYVGWLAVSPSVDDDRIVLADTGLFTSGTWAHWAFKWSDAGDTCELYKNGVSLATRTSGLLAYTVGEQSCWGNASTNIGVNASAAGDMAECAVYANPLNDPEVAALAAGFSPLLVAPFVLYQYLPLYGRGTEFSLFESGSYTVTGTLQSDHPRIFNPVGQQIVVPTGSGGGGGSIRRRNQVLVF